MPQGKTPLLIRVLAASWILWFLLPFLILLFSFTSGFSTAKSIFSDPRFISAFWISFSSAIIVIALCLLFAVPTAYFLTYQQFRFKKILEALLIDIPQTYPPVAVGVIYLFFFGSKSPLNLAYTFIAVIIAKLIVSAPFTISHTLRKFREIKESHLDLIARSLGASPKSLIFKLLIPLSLREITAGLTLSWARAMGEFGGSLVFAGVIAYKTEILPTYTNRVVNTSPYLALGATFILTVFSILAIVTVRTLMERGERA